MIRIELTILSDYVHRKSLTPDWHVFRAVGTYLVSAVDNLIDPAKRENALVFAITSFGIVQSQATLFSLIILAIILTIGMIGGIIYLVKNILYKSKGII